MSNSQGWTPEGGENAQSAAEWANQVGFHETQAKKRSDDSVPPAGQASAGAAGQAYLASQGQGYPAGAGQHPRQARHPGTPYANPQQGAWNQPYPAQSHFPGAIPGGVPVPYAGGGPMIAPQKSKVAAGVLALLLGSIGVHKFYLGYFAQGVIMLLSVLFTFGIASIVTGPIALAEGIIYLTKSDEEFYRVYELGRRGWF